MMGMKLMFVAADKYLDDSDKHHLETDCDQKCRFGYCWWYWLPRFESRLKTEYKIIEVTWLRFSLSYEGML